MFIFLVVFIIFIMFIYLVVAQKYNSACPKESVYLAFNIILIVAIFIVLCLEIYDMSLLVIYTLSKYVKLQFIFLLSENTL
jgi:hypothetical protein